MREKPDMQPPSRGPSVVVDDVTLRLAQPLDRFSGQTVDRLGRLYVPNGHEIRSYAARFFRA